jgi:hypothetical protein
MNKLHFGLSLVLASTCALLPAGAASAASRLLFGGAGGRSMEIRSRSEE